MMVKKNKGKIFGAVLTSSEKKAMQIEIKRQLDEWDRKHRREIDALILWQLHEQLGFGEKRLKKFYMNFASELKKLSDRYALDEEDQIWLCTYKLKDELGIDLEDWVNEADKAVKEDNYD